MTASPAPRSLAHIPEPAGSELGWLSHARLMAMTVVGLLVATMVAGVMVDPRDQFSHQVIDPLAWDEPAIKMHHFEAMAPAHTLILGNSRVMKIEAAEITNYTDASAFNWGLSGTTLEDALRLLRHFINHGQAPAEILVGVASARLATGTPASNRTYEILGPMHGESGAIDALEAAFDTLSPWYLRDSAASFWNYLGGPYFAQVAFDETGGIHYLPVEKQQVAGAYDGAKRVASGLAGYQGDPAPATIDAARWATLDALVQTATDAGIQVRLFIPPVHPSLLAHPAAQTYNERLDAVRHRIPEFCAPNVSVHDFSSIESFGGDPDDFYDPFHPLEQNTRKLVAVLYSPTSGLC